MENVREKKALFSALAGFVVVVTILFIYTVFWGALSGSREYPTHNISVSAVGKSVAKPDVAKFSFSVIAEGKDTKVISDEANTKITKAIDLLKSKGIDAKDIQTTEYNLSPVYSQPVGMVYSGTYVPTIAKYSLTQTVQVKIRNFDLISEIMGSLAPLGINRVSSLSFSIDDPETYRAVARAEAIEKAQKKAEAMAQALGVSLGNVVNVSEYSQEPSNYGIMEGKGGVMSAPLMPVAPTIEAGSQDVTVNVNITYELK